jgi:hypothetical protein
MALRQIPRELMRMFYIAVRIGQRKGIKPARGLNHSPAVWEIVRTNPRYFARWRSI